MSSKAGQGTGEDWDEKKLKKVAEEMWTYRGQKLPEFADKPKAGQESVWLYPRPPALLPEKERVQVFLGKEVLADTTNALKMCETAHPPTYYIPVDDIKMKDILVPLAGRTSWCEWKGTCRYFTLKGGREIVAWAYQKPHSSLYKAIGNCMCFYIDRQGITAQVGEHKPRAQGGGFYGGWVIPALHAGPFKGDPGVPHM